MILSAGTCDFLGRRHVYDREQVLDLGESVRLFGQTPFRALDVRFWAFTSFAECPFLAADQWQDYIARACAAAADCGISFVQGHAPFSTPDGKRDPDRVLPLIARSLEACSTMGIPCAVVHSPCEYQRHEEIQAYFGRILDVVERTGVTICIECGWDDEQVAQAAALVDAIGHPLVKACLDVGHINLGKGHPYENIITLGPRLRCIHVHDNLGAKDDHDAPFCGTIDFDAIIRGLLDIGFRGPFNFECDEFFRNAPIELRVETRKLLYAVGKYLLEQHGCFEG